MTKALEAVASYTHAEAVTKLRELFGTLATFEWSEIWDRDNDRLLYRVVIDQSGKKFRSTVYVTNGESFLQGRGLLVKQLEEQVVG